MSYIQWVVCMCACFALAQDDLYCSVRYERLCQGKGAHVGCQFPFRGSGPSCENYTAIIFTNDLKQFILHYVNRRRQKIASGHERVRGGVHLPKPEIMMLVQWDRELAYLAQRLADQCEFVHDDCRATVRYPFAGQTVGEVRWRRSDTSLDRGARRTVGRVFDAWWGERRRVHAKQLTSPFVLTARGAVWGHFSQLAVWTLRAMGCGAVHHGSTRPRLLLVCDFSHTNMLGQRTISPGPQAACPPHTVRGGRPYPLLCAAPVVYGKQVIDEHLEDDEFDIEGDDGGYDEFDEDQDTIRRPQNNKAYEDVDLTEPKPNRKVRPIPQDTVDTTSQPNKQYYGKDNQSSKEEYATDYQQTKKEFRNKNIFRDYTETQVNKQSDKNINAEKTSYKTINKEAGYKTDDVAKQNYGDPFNTDSYSYNENQRKVDKTNQRAQSLNTQRMKMTDKSLIPEDPTILQENEQIEYRDIKPIQDIVVYKNRDEVDTTAPILVDRPDPSKDRYDRLNRLKKVGEKTVNLRPVIPIYDDSVNSDRRPMIPLQDDDVEDTEKKKNPSKIFNYKMNDELINSRNREPVQNWQELRNQETETEHKTKNVPLKKAFYKTEDNYRNDEIARKGEFKAKGYFSEDSEIDQKPYRVDRWRYEDPDPHDRIAVLPLAKSTRSPKPHLTTVVIYRPTSLFSIQTEPVSRQRWMQSRMRPRRPGANALMQTVNRPPHVVMIAKKASLVLDKEIEEQLFRDTGFKLSTKKR